VRVLLVEDEDSLAKSIAKGLRREGMAVDIAGDGETGLEKATLTSYDVVLLDRDLPVTHGDVVCQALVREGTAARILMLTAAGAVDQRVEGLTLGADDYLAKPFAFSELIARVRALGRRTGTPTPTTLSWGDLALDPARREASRGGRLLSLTGKEFAVLERLVRASGAIVSAETLLEQVWDEHADPFTNTVRTTIYTLRRKLGEPALVETIVGAGYRMVS
jgi:DNA-binding response OmpR family regulator